MSPVEYFVTWYLLIHWFGVKRRSLTHLRLKLYTRKARQARG